MTTPIKDQFPLICPRGTSARIDHDHGDVLQHWDGTFCNHPNLPDKVEEAPVPFVWLPRGLAEGPLTEAVGESIGLASMCWVGGTGDLEYDSTMAIAVVDGLMAYLSDWEAKIRAEANEATAAKLVGVPAAHLSTVELLEELRMRGDLMLVAHPTSDLAADGAVLSGVAGAALKALGKELLDYRTVDSR